MTRIMALIYRFLQKMYEKDRVIRYRELHHLHSTVTIGANLILDGNIHIGLNSYINSGLLQTGPNSKIVIGQWCAIGNNVNILAVTHDTELSTGPDRPTVERDIYIGNHVWIGSNVYIREGCSIGNNTIIGANSVVIKDIPENAIVGGIPAKIIKFKNIPYRSEHEH